jgi:hypothetical protein
MHLTFPHLIQTLKMQIHICTLASLDLDASTSRSAFAALSKDDQLLKTLYDIFLPETCQGNHIVWALCLNSLSSGGEPNITLLRRMSDRVDCTVRGKLCRHWQEFEVPNNDGQDGAHLQICKFLAWENALASDSFGGIS